MRNVLSQSYCISGSPQMGGVTRTPCWWRGGEGLRVKHGKEQKVFSSCPDCLLLLFLLSAVGNKEDHLPLFSCVFFPFACSLFFSRVPLCSFLLGCFLSFVDCEPMEQKLVRAFCRVLWSLIFFMIQTTAVLIALM